MRFSRFDCCGRSPSFLCACWIQVVTECCDERDCILVIDLRILSHNHVSEEDNVVSISNATVRMILKQSEIAFMIVFISLLVCGVALSLMTFHYSVSDVK